MSQSLYTYLRQQPAEGTYTIEVLADPRIGRTAREALLIVRCAQVQIQRPDKLSAQDYPKSVTLYAVEGQEVCPPAGQEPIHWRLLTTHRVVCLEQALCIIEWYRWRWRIEQLFATQKPRWIKSRSYPVRDRCSHSTTYRPRFVGRRANPTNG